jgi:hypothetical protein
MPTFLKGKPVSRPSCSYLLRLRIVYSSGVLIFDGTATYRHPHADDPRIGIIFEVLSLLQISGASHLLIECVDGMLYHRNGTENGEQAEIICIALRILVDLG